MNPIAFNKKFKDLTGRELWQVVDFYIDKNHYQQIPFRKSAYSVPNVIEYFENNYHSIHVLKEFYKYWN